MYVFILNFPKVKNGQEITLLLKKEKLGSASKGSITLVLEVIYNKVKIKSTWSKIVNVDNSLYYML